MADPDQLVARGREGDIVDPATRSMTVLGHDCSEGHLLAPRSRLWLTLDLLHVGREHSGRVRMVMVSVCVLVKVSEY